MQKYCNIQKKIVILQMGDLNCIRSIKKGDNGLSFLTNSSFEGISSGISLVNRGFLHPQY